ncbi:MAG: ABC-F family ATP-binding cassette domain-containing protein [Erysipelotrichaceae bacterium]|nr:ABC-F family ATP-binding cassette domain-containing protein [Erysipelotrichaceae bacterium]
MLISVENICKYHNEKQILKNARFTINEYDKIGVIGVNGAGKTTLLRMIAGLEHYDSGNMIKKNGLQIAYVSQNPVFEEEETILYQVLQGKDDVELFEAKAILNKLGLSEYERKVKHLSGGERKRVALARALCQPCDLLILDEPTNHLDTQMITWLETYLMKYRRALFMVTHDRYFLERVTHKLLEVDKGALYTYEANYSQFLELKAKREQDMVIAEKKRQRLFKKELAWIRAGVQARGTKSKGRIARFHALCEQEQIIDTKQLSITTTSSRLGKKTIEAYAIGQQYHGKYLFRNFAYTMQRNDRIGIIGENGSGKTTLMNILAKQIEASEGYVEHGETLQLGYYKQGVEEMDPQMRVLAYIQETSHTIETSQGVLNATQMLERFLFPTAMHYQPIATLSGGEKRRLYLLKILMQNPNVLFLDEPTNDLDIQTLTILEDYLDQFSGIVVIVSHDRYFLDRLCQCIFMIQRNGEITKHIGGYSSFIEEYTQEESTLSKNIGKENQKKAITKKMTSAQKRDLETMEEQIALLEKQIETIDEQMLQVQDDFKQIEVLANQREEVVQQLEQKMEQWVYLTELKKEIEQSILK